MDHVIKVSGLSKTFAGVRALDDVDLTIAPGEIHCLAGENGSGKSTLIKVISGVYTPDSGTIDLAGTEHSRLTPIEAINAGVKVIYQDFSVFPNLTVMENLALNSELADGRRVVSWRRFREIATQAVAKIGVQLDLDARVGDLSVADKQLVAICRALMGQTRLLIMDEPTTALTAREVEALFRVVLALKDSGIAILFVSHKLSEVFEISDRFTILRNGRVVITSLPEELDHKSFAYYMTGREFADVGFEPGPLGEDPILEASGLTLEGAFTDVNLSLRPGEILGITGLLGSGRTELALSLFGVFPVDSGEIRIAGEAVRLRDVRDAIAHGIAYVPEDRLTEGLMLERSIANNIVISEIDALSGPLGLVNDSATADEVVRWVSDLKIATDNPDNAVNTLSGGNQQRVVLAKWLATKPRILILNGPTVGVDIGSKNDIHLILADLAHEGMGIIVISDDIPELLQTCSRIALLHNGRIVGEVDPRTTSETELARLIMAGSGEEHEL